MAIPNEAITSGLKVYIEAVQTVIPAILTDPRQPRQVSIAKGTGSGIFHRCFHVILYYIKAPNEDSGWLVAGWTKESLSFALSEQPIFAGRLRRVEVGDGELEIVPNDSGVRLVEARIPINLEEFLNLRNKEEAESQLVFWESIDEQNPQFSPLLYVQVTNFKCGGYSIGISTSLLLADPLVMASFLKRWANIHNKILTKTQIPKLPIVYLPNLGKATSTPPYPHPSPPTKNIGQTLIFKFAQKNMTMDSEMQKTAAIVCMEETERRLGRKMTSNISLMVKEITVDIKVEIVVKKGVLQEYSRFKNWITSGISWEDYLGTDGISISSGNKPATSVSYWINPLFDEGLVMIIPSADMGISAIVTIPSDNKVK